MNKYDWYSSNIIYMNYDKNREKAIIDELKVLVALLAAETTNIFLTAILPERTEEEQELDQIQRYMVFIIRSIIVIFSINNDWPLAICVTISVVISVIAIIIKTSVNNKEKEN